MTDQFGNQIKCFLGPIVVVTDYPSSSSLLDVRSHSSNAPCTFWSFRKRKNRTGSEFSHTSPIHSNSLDNFETYERSIELLQNGITESDGQQIGIRDGYLSLLNQVPLFQLYFGLLDKTSIIPKTIDTLPVMSTNVDPYTLMALAPDNSVMGFTIGFQR